MQAVGYLLIGVGESEIFRGLRRRLTAGTVPAVQIAGGQDPLAEAQRGLYAVGRLCRRACVVAEGEMWAAALALAVQLSVDRIVLIDPMSVQEQKREGREKRLERLKAYVRRNLFFCISDVLTLETGPANRGLDRLCSRMINARVWRLQADSGSEHTAAEEALGFLLEEDIALIAERGL